MLNAFLCEVGTRGGISHGFVLRERYFQSVGDVGVDDDGRAFPPIRRLKNAHD